MRGRIAFGFLLIGLLPALAACGGGQPSTTATTDSVPTTTTTTTAPPETTKLRVYFLRKGKVQPVAREVPKTQAVLSAALEELLAGPTDVEQRDLQLSSAQSADFTGVSISNGVARPEGVIDISRPGLAQIVYTLTQFPTVEAVEIGGNRYTRADFEDETPIILVESPLPFETVASPLHATGTANTFEANFEYEVVEPEGRIVDSYFVTATSGTGTRGTFDFTTKPYEVSRSGLGALVVFESSAKDGSRIHIVEIPVSMTK